MLGGIRKRSYEYHPADQHHLRMMLPHARQEPIGPAPNEIRLIDWNNDHALIAHPSDDFRAATSL